MDFKIKTLKFKSGEEIIIRETEDGGYVCPICGFVGRDEPPYADSQALVNGQRVGTVSAGASFEICPVCATQYGDDDFPNEDEPQSRNWKWQQLRREWLRRIEITDEVKNQLRNLDLEPDAEIRQAKEEKDSG